MTNPVRAVTEQVQKWTGLRAQLEKMEDIDDKALIDTLDGETNLTELLFMLADEVAERECFSDALSLRIKDLQDRKQRVEKGTDTIRTIILQAMDRAGIPSLTGVTATLAVRHLEPEVHIETEADIPAKYWIPQDPKLDKKALREDLAFERVPGARLGNGRISLTIRRK